jgi:flagellar motor switch protein FliG
MGMSKDEQIDGARIAALILSRMPAATQDRVVKALQRDNPAVAAKVEDTLYNFDRIADVRSSTMQNLLQDVPHRDLVVSLKAVDEKTKEHIFENLSETKQRMVEEDYETLPPMKVSDVQAAQRRILKKLEELYPDAALAMRDGKSLSRSG